MSFRREKDQKNKGLRSGQRLALALVLGALVSCTGAYDRTSGDGDGLGPDGKKVRTGGPSKSKADLDWAAQKSEDLGRAVRNVAAVNGKLSALLADFEFRIKAQLATLNEECGLGAAPVGSGPFSSDQGFEVNLATRLDSSFSVLNQLPLTWPSKDLSKDRPQGGPNEDPSASRWSHTRYVAIASELAQVPRLDHLRARGSGGAFVADEPRNLPAHEQWTVTVTAEPRSGAAGPTGNGGSSNGGSTSGPMSLALATITATPDFKAPEQITAALTLDIWPNLAAGTVLRRAGDDRRSPSPARQTSDDVPSEAPNEVGDQCIFQWSAKGDVEELDCAPSGRATSVIGQCKVLFTKLSRSKKENGYITRVEATLNLSGASPGGLDDKRWLATYSSDPGQAPQFELRPN